jgi:hypothetical protein
LHITPPVTCRKGNTDDVNGKMPAQHQIWLVVKAHAPSGRSEQACYAVFRLISFAIYNGYDTIDICKRIFVPKDFGDEP